MMQADAPSNIQLSSHLKSIKAIPLELAVVQLTASPYL
jgi:hypothetical protein